MLSNFEKEIEEILPKLNDEQLNRLKIDVLQRLVKRLAEDEHVEIEEQLNEVIEILKNTEASDINRRNYLKVFRNVQRKVQGTYGYVEKGTLQGMYVGTMTAIAPGVGAGIGTAFGNVGAGIGVAIGLLVGIGAAIGASKEKQARDKGLVY